MITAVGLGSPSWYDAVVLDRALRIFTFRIGSEALAPTPEECARIRAAFEEWRGIRQCAEPADRARAERAIGETYARIGRKTPVLVWCGSPLSCVGATQQRRTAGHRSLVRELSGKLSIVGGRARLHRALMGMGVERPVGSSDALMRGLGIADFLEFWSSQVGNLGTHIRYALRPTIGQLENYALPGQSGPYWSAGWSLVRRLFGDDLVGEWLGEAWPATRDVLALMEELARSCGWWFPFDDVCFVSERPSALHHDECLELHAPDRFAMAFPDGFGICAWHGTAVPSGWILDREHASPLNALSWDDMSQRKALAEILGWDHVLAALHGTLVDDDPSGGGGVLYAGKLPGGQETRFLRNRYGEVVRVPPNIETVHEAEAWSSSAFVPGVPIPGRSNTYELLLDPTAAEKKLQTLGPHPDVRMYEHRGQRELTESGWRWVPIRRWDFWT